MDYLFYEEGILILLVVFLVIAFVVLHCALVYATFALSDKNGRSKLWGILSLFFALVPLFAVFCLGETDKARHKRICQEEKLKEKIRKGEEVKN